MDRKVIVGRSTKASDQNYSIKTVDNDDYTILDTDKFDAFFVITGGVDRTITLPTAADNEDRILSFMKIDAGVGAVIIDGEDAETINEELTVNLPSQYNRSKIAGNGTEWFISELLATYVTDWLLNEMTGPGVADWTNVHLGNDPTDPTDNFTHNLDTPLSDLLVKLIVSTDGTDNNSFEIMVGTFGGGIGVADIYGYQIDQVDSNNLLIQTGDKGLPQIDVDGSVEYIDIDDWYYKIVVYRLR